MSNLFCSSVYSNFDVQTNFEVNQTQIIHSISINTPKNHAERKPMGKENEKQGTNGKGERETNGKGEQETGNQWERITGNREPMGKEKGK